MSARELKESGIVVKVDDERGAGYVLVSLPLGESQVSVSPAEAKALAAVLVSLTGGSPVMEQLDRLGKSVNARLDEIEEALDHVAAQVRGVKHRLEQ